MNGLGVIIHGYITRSNIHDKINQCKFGYKSYEKILIDLDGVPYDENVFLYDLKVVDGIVIDLRPPINGMGKNYNKLYKS